MRVLDLFAGCGGLTRGFVDAGFEVAGAVEFDLSAAATYAANFGDDHTFFGDIADYIRAEQIPHADVVIGGPPCQGFSNLGSRDPDDPRNRLWEHFVEVVLDSGAAAFVIENVDRFRTSAEYERLQELAQPGQTLGEFELQAMTLNAADFGVPQRRRRTIVIGSRVGRIDRPKRSRTRDPEGGQHPWKSVRSAIGALALQPEGIHLPRRIHEYAGEEVSGPYSLAEIHVGRTYQKMSLERYAAISEGGNRFDLPERLKYECWKKHKRGAADVLGRLRWDAPSLTIRTEFFKPEKGRYLHPDNDRALTHAEAALLQGFDARHKWCGSKLQIARQIGNAVPPPLAKAIARPIMRALLAEEASSDRREAA